MKTWKIVQLVGVLMLLTGVVVRVAGYVEGMFLILLGVLGYAIGRVSVWLTKPE